MLFQQKIILGWEISSHKHQNTIYKVDKIFHPILIPSLPFSFFSALINISEKGTPSRRSLFEEWRKKCINLFSAQATTISGKILRLISYLGGWGKNSRIRKRLLYHLNRVNDELCYDVIQPAHEACGPEGPAR